MQRNLLTGTLVRLAATNPAQHAATEASWSKDTVYTRLLEVDAVMPPRIAQSRVWMESPLKADKYTFAILTLADDQFIGTVTLMHIRHSGGEAFVGIGIGNPAYRGRGYGGDAMRTVLRFAFHELNLHRVSLDAVATNAQAVRSYEKCGFVHEGQTRGTDWRGGIRTNLVGMGILRAEWDKLQQ